MAEIIDFKTRKRLNVDQSDSPTRELLINENNIIQLVDGLTVTLIESLAQRFDLSGAVIIIPHAERDALAIIRLYDDGSGTEKIAELVSRAYIKLVQVKKDE